MELLQWLTLAVFAVTITAVVVNKLYSAAAALVGVGVVVEIGSAISSNGRSPRREQPWS